MYKRQPKGGSSVIVDAKSGKVVREERLVDAAGIAPSAWDFVTSSYAGEFAGIRSNVAWDQHIVRLGAG